MEGEEGGWVGREEQDTAAASSLTLGEALLPKAREEVEEARGAWGDYVGEVDKGTNNASKGEKQGYTNKF